FGWFTRARIQFDARSATAYGTLRSFASLDFKHTSDNAIAGANGDGTGIDKAFIQWAGLTVGRAQSFYDFYAGDYEDAGGSDITVSTLAYTASFGGGMSATLALENNRDRLVEGFAWNNNGAVLTTLSGRSNQVPDVIGVFRVDQGWGSAQLSAALHNVNVTEGATGTGANYSHTGFAVQGGVKFNVPSMGAGDAFWLQAAYANGALSYIGVGSGPQDILGNGFNHTDGDLVTEGAGAVVQIPTGFSVLGAFEHHFGPTFWLAPYIGYLNVSYSNHYASSLQTNWNQIIAGVDTHWDPVTNLDFNLLLRYSDLNQGTPGGGVVPVPIVGGGTFKNNTDTFFVRLNIERDF
ncbi:MAG: porin, partial [Hyphomicrobiales bacterium]|nr:porin [Hyphomicrobiales bacterium]